MRPSARTIAFDSNENSTNTYFYTNKGGYVWVQFSWQTCNPNAHLVHKSMPLNYNFWNCYPLELSYDWYFDYHIHDIRLGRMKYHTLPDDVANLLHHRIIRFNDYTKPPFKHGYNLIGYRNNKVIKVLNKVCNFRVSFNPSQALIDYDTRGLNEIIDRIKTKNDAKRVLNNALKSYDPFTLDTKVQDIEMALTGYGFTAISIMRKIYRARKAYITQYKLNRE